MIFNTVERSKLLTVIPLIIAAAVLVCTVAAIFYPVLWITAAAIALIMLLGYAWTPVGYDFNQEACTISVIFPFCVKQLGKISACTLEVKAFSCTIRLCGNGGLFGISGLFWSKKLGRFRVYATSTKSDDIIELTIAGKSVFISPDNPEKFARLCADALASSCRQL
jgi:hypothetical protein